MTSPDLPELIAEVRRLDAEATKGPWDSEYDGNGYHINGGGVFVGDHYEGYREDAALIAHYRTAAPLLADECSRLQERVRVLVEALVNISAYLPPGSGSVALQVCADMRADARAALEGIE